MKKYLSNRKGFTLIELMVVMAIIAVLAVLILGAITAARNAAKLTTHRSNAKTIQIGMEGYYTKSRTYPATGTYAFNNAIVTGTGAGQLGLTLSSTPECTVATQTGGGTLVITASGYTITPYDAACTAALTGDDVITGP